MEIEWDILLKIIPSWATVFYLCAFFVFFSFEIMFIFLCGFYLFLFSRYCLTGILKQMQYVMKSISIQGDSLPAHLKTLE